MKKLLASMAATVVAGSAFAQTSGTVETKIGGDFRSRYFSYDNYQGVNNGRGANFINNRAKVNIGMSKGDSLSAFVSLVHNNTFGSSALNNVPSTTTANGSYNSGWGKQDNGLMVNQAYGWWKSSDMFALTIGRMAVDIADGKFFSFNDWQSLPTTHDGIKAGLNFDIGTLDLFMVRNSVRGALYNNATEQQRTNDAYIASFTFKNLPEVMKTGNIIFANMVNQLDANGAAATKSGTMQHIGLSVGGDVMGIMYSAAVGLQSGKSINDESVSGTMYDLMVGYNLPETMGLKLWAGYHMDSGDKNSTTNKDEGYTSLFYNIRENGGKMDIFRWGNLTYARLGAAIKPMDNTEVGVEYLMFSRTEKTGGITNGFAYTTGSNLAGTTSTALGNEIDLWARHNYDNGFNIGANIGMFTAGSALKNATAKYDKNMMQVMVEGGFTF